jgi:4-amino-4-deoxy-L-arabinose transferase-like glycosyltransferase
MMKNRTPLLVMLLLGISFLLLLSFYPSMIPAPWFDEGWTLAVARNWVKTGHYARLLNDKPISAIGMAWNFPVTSPIALSFHLFGIGVWQGRLPSTIFTIASILLVYLLGRQMYGERIAVTAILVLLLGFPFPLTEGRQAIGEPAMIFYLLAGFYTFWMFLEKRSILSIGGSMLFWGAALTSKQQP